MHSYRKNLLHQYPTKNILVHYWPKQLALPVINTYSEPGVVIEIVDIQGQIRYPTTTSTT